MSDADHNNSNSKASSSSSKENPSSSTKNHFKKKCGVKPGGTIVNDKTRNEWCTAVERFEQEKKKNPKLSYGNFLASMAGPKFSNTHSQRTSFGRYLKLHRDGTLERSCGKRKRDRKFDAVETKLVEYLKNRQSVDNGDVSWSCLKRKCEQWHQADPDLAEVAFKCSNGWLNDALKRNGLTQVKQAPNAEADERWLEEAFTSFLEDHDIPIARVSDAAGKEPLYLKLKASIASKRGSSS